MDEDAFDELARALGGPRTRRGAAGLVAGGMLAAFGAVAGARRHGTADGQRTKKHKGKKGKDKKRCPAGQTRCGKACTNVQADPANCGSCGNACGAGQICAAGACGALPPAGPTFTVSGRAIEDANGNPVVLRGVNKMSVYDEEDPKGEISFPEIRKTGANTVRIVWGITRDTSPNGPKTDPAVLDALIANAKANGLVPMVELHDATGKWSLLGTLVDYWVQPTVVDVIRKHSQYLLVNIGNEVGDDSVTDAQFIGGYTSAVQRMRGAGIRTPLVIDAQDFGKNLEILNRTAATLLAADPDHNLIFSVHTYWGIADGATPQYIRGQFEAAVAANYPLIVGEFSAFGAYNGNQSICAEGGRIDYKTIIAEAQRLGIGWYAWEWGPGNEFGDVGCKVMDMTTDRRFANLQPGWATEVATTDPNSIKNTAKNIL